MDANPGPIDGSVLYDQDKHVSAAVWDGQERGALRCHEHTSKLGEWRLTPKQIELVEKAGFGYLRKIPAISLDNPLISALVERWRRETNTFHFSVGEMTVTLQDVALLLGLAIDGKPVIGITHTACGSVCEKLLGKAPDSSYASGGMVKLSWLKEFFSQCPENVPTQQVEHCTRAYLLYLVGSTIFSTTTGNKVPVMYLPLFENFEESGRFAWGAAALAFLYRALGNACVKSQSTICGCLTLLQCWSYFHLNIGRPKLNRDPIHDHFPFVLRWKGKQSGPTTNRDVVFYRKALDSLKPSDVEWLPYKYMDSTVIPEDIKDTLILGRSKTMLICFDKAERHLPDRCLRQYGMLQPIPDEVVRWVRKSRGVDGGVDLSGKMESELNEWSDRRLYIVDGEDGVDEIEYMQWYLRITRKVVGRPISLSSEFQRTISGLREIAYLADSFSTKGLDGQQFESITRIRFIAQDCLRDQAGSPVTPSATTQIELGKRSRGKERIRRKDSIKRRRKDDETEYYEGSEDDQSQFYGAVIEVDQLPLRQDDVRELQLPQADDEVDPQQLYLTPDEENIAELHVMVNKADDANLSNTSGDINNNQPCDKTNESVKDSQVCDATMEDVGDPMTHDSIYEVNASQLHQLDTSEVPGSKPSDTTKKVNDQELHNTTISGATDTNLSDPIKVNKDLHLPDASDDTKELQLPDGTKEGDSSQVVDAPVDSQDLQHPNATEEKNGLQLPGATKEDKSLQPHGATKEGLQIPDAAKQEKGLEIPHAAKEVNGSWIRKFDEGSGSQVSDATKEGSSSQVPDAAKNGAGSQVPDQTEGPKDLLLQEAAEKGKDLQIQETAKRGKDLQSQEAAEKGKKAARKGKELQIKEAAGKEKEVQLQETAKKGKDLQIQEAAGKGKGAVGKGKDVQFHEAARKGKEMRLQEAAGKEKRLQPQEASKKGNKLQPQEAAKKEELQPHRAEEKGKDLQLQEAVEKGKELQLQEKAEKEELQVPDTTIEAEKRKELHVQDTTSEGKDPQFSDATEDKELELNNATKEGKDFQLSDATEKGNLGPSNATGGTNDMQPPDATNEESDPKPSHSADGSDPLAAESAPKDVPKGVVQS